MNMLTLRWLELIVEAANVLVANQPFGALRPTPADLETLGPRPHRPGSGRGPQRHHITVATGVHAGVPIGYAFSAEEITVSEIRAEVGETVKARRPDREAAALDLSLSWEDDPGADDEEAGR